MNTPDPQHPGSSNSTNYHVPPGWERFQTPPAWPLPVMQPPPAPVVMVEKPETMAASPTPIAEERDPSDDGAPPQPAVMAGGRQSSRLGRLWRQAGGGSLMLSVGVHLGLVALAGLVIISTQRPDALRDFVPAGTTKAGEEASGELQHQITTRRQVSLLRKPPAQTRIGVEGPADVPLPDAEVPVLPDASTVGRGPAALMGAGSGPGMPAMPGLNGSVPSRFLAGLPNTFGARCSDQSRLEKLRQNGGSPECEAAVSRSLAWLKAQQNTDGSWGRANKAAMTGLTLLCFLGRCETPESPFYGEEVRNGMLYLIELGRKNSHGILSEQPQSNAATYEHGIATYALGELYSFYRLGNSSLPGLRATFEKGVTVIISEQNRQGAWTYGGKDAGMPHAYNKESGGEDLSVTGWQFQALKAAKHSGLKIAGLDDAVRKCCDYLESKQTKDGGFGKTNRDEHYNQWSLTGCGVLGLQTLAKNKAAPVKNGIRFLRDFLTAEPLDWDRNCNLYCWYYYTQAFFQAGGDDWKFYNAQFLPQILKAQQPDGSFRRGRPNWPAGDAADAIYRQALCTLQLEVYYRYLKVADREEQSLFER